MLKRFSFLVAFIVALMMVSSGMAMAATGAEATSAVTVTVESAVSITGLDAIAFNATPGSSAQGADSFVVSTNVAGSTIDAVVTNNPKLGGNGAELAITCNLSPTTLNTIPGNNAITLYAKIALVPFVTAGSYSNGLITVTVTVP